MKYKTKQQAKQAAENFALLKMDEGLFVAKKENDGFFIVATIDYGLLNSDQQCFCWELLPEIENDTPVWVRDHDNDKWVRRHATGDFDDDGYIRCYYHGMTSFTAPSVDWASWQEYSLTDPTK